MAHVAITIAEAVKEELNDQYSPATFTATRRYTPTFDLKDLTTLTVTVVPKSLEKSFMSRRDTDRRVEVDIGIQQKLDAGQSQAEQLAAIDALMLIADGIDDYMENRRLTDVAAARWRGSETTVLYGPEQLQENRAFLAVVKITYSLERDRTA